MKRFIFSLGIALLSSNALTANAKLAHYYSDQSSYVVGSRAVFFVSLDQKSSNPEQELFPGLKVGEEDVPLVFLSDQLAVAFPVKFAAPGNVGVDLDVYLQDKSLQQTMDESIALLNADNINLENAKTQERDAEAKALLQARIDENNITIVGLNAEKTKNRSLRELTHGDFLVAPSNKNEIVKGTKYSGIFSLAADHTDGHYLVGQRATYTAHPFTDFSGPDGPREIVFRGDLDGQNIFTQFNGTDYFFQTANFTSAGIGAHTFRANLLIRSKAQADLLRSAKVQGMQQKTILENALAISTGAGERAYYQYKINQLASALVVLDQQLESILLQVDSISLPLNVTN
jgi:hypothetical protein